MSKTITETVDQLVKQGKKPNAYEVKIKPYLDDIKRWIIEDKLALPAIAKKLGVGETTIYRSQKEQAEFCSLVASAKKIQKEQISIL